MPTVEQTIVDQINKREAEIKRLRAALAALGVAAAKSKSKPRTAHGNAGKGEVSNAVADVLAKGAATVRELRAALPSFSERQITNALQYGMRVKLFKGRKRVGGGPAKYQMTNGAAE